MTTATPKASTPNADDRQHVRIVNGGTPALVSTRDALTEINHAMMGGKRDVRRMSASGSEAYIVYKDPARGNVSLRPADKGEKPPVQPQRPTDDELTGDITDSLRAFYAETHPRVADGTAIPVCADMVRPGMDVLLAARLEDRTIGAVTRHHSPGTPWVSVQWASRFPADPAAGNVFDPEFHLMVTRESLDRVYGTAPSLGVEERQRAAEKDQRRALAYAGRWWAEQGTDTPTDDALRDAFRHCVKQPRPELYPAIRDAIAANMPPVAAAPLFAAHAAYETVLHASETPMDLQNVARHMEELRRAAPRALHTQIHAAAVAADEAWPVLKTAGTLAERTDAHDRARHALVACRTAILAVAPHANRMHGTDLPATADAIRAAARAYNAVDGTPEELNAASSGTPLVRVKCRADSGTGWDITAVITAGVDDGPSWFITAHPPLVVRFRRTDGRADAAENARKVIGAMFRVDVPVEYVADRRI